MRHNIVTITVEINEANYATFFKLFKYKVYHNFQMKPYYPRPNTT